MSIAAEPALLVFDPNTRNQAFTVSGDACGEALDFTVEAASSWIVLTPASGSVLPGGTATVIVSLLDSVQEAANETLLILSAAGTVNVSIIVEPVAPT